MLGFHGLLRLLRHNDVTLNTTLTENFQHFYIKKKTLFYDLEVVFLMETKKCPHKVKDFQYTHTDTHTHTSHPQPIHTV